MKRFAGLVFAVALLCGCLAFPVGAAADSAGAAGLKFNADTGKFKIIHISDTQEFLISSTITQDFLYDLAKNEKPDLFVLTGDNDSTGGAKDLPKFLAKWTVKSSVDTLMRVFDRIYNDFGIPVTMVFGNHDNEAAPTVSRAEQFAMYKAHKSFIGYYIPKTDEGTADEQGQHYGTHNLVIYNRAGATPQFNLWLFDSGSYDERGGYSGVQTQQVDWFKGANNGLPSFAFQHIVVPEVYDSMTRLPKEEETDDLKWKFSAGVNVVGELREDPCPGKYNWGQYAALSSGNVLALFFGHDHKNTYEIRFPGGTDLVNTPCSGYGSYGDTDLRGARIITLDDSDLTTYKTSLVSYRAYYGGSELRQARADMFQALSSFGSVVDVFTFKPLLWMSGLFK